MKVLVCMLKKENYMNKCYSGYLANSDSLLKSASGGIAYAIALDYVSTGGIAYGVGYKEDFSGTAWIRCVCKEDLKEIRGTKYVKAEAKIKRTEIIVYDEVLHDLTCGKRVVFFGLPCEVGVLTHRLKRQGINTNQLLTVDLICQGPSTSRLFKEFLEIKKKEYSSEPKSINMRFKNPDWRHPYFRIIFKNNKEYCVPLQQTEFWAACVNMPMISCSKCSYKGENHVSDITIGDHWGVNEKSESYNMMGTSIALVHTQKGELAINSIQEFTYFETDCAEVIRNNPRYSKSAEIDRKKIRFKKLYEKHGLLYAFKHRYSFVDKIKMIMHLG